MAIKIDTLEVEIKHKAEQTSKSIDLLTASLKKMKNLGTQGGFGLGTLAKQLKAFHDNISNMDLSDSATKLTKMSNALKKISEQVNGLNLTALKELNKAMRGLSGGGQKAVEKKVKNVGDAAKESTKEVKELNKEVKKTDEPSKGGLLMSLLGKKSGGFLKSIGRIALYRGIRTALKAVTTAVKQGTTNLYQYSKMMGGSFADNMDKAATSIQYLVNGLAVGVAPIIQWLTPMIITAADAMANFGNAISEVVADAKGESYFTRAKKTFKEFAEAAKEAKSAVLGFDELNVIDKETSYEDMFETVAVDAETIEVKSWGIASALSAIAGIAVGGGALKAILDLSQAGVLETTTAGIASLGGTITLAAAALALYATKGEDIKKTLDGWSDAIKGFGDAIDSFTGNNAYIGGFFDTMAAVVGSILEGLGTIPAVIYDLAHLDFTSAFENIMNFFCGITNATISIFMNWAKWIVGTLEGIANFAIGNLNKLGANIEEVHWTDSWTMPQVHFSVEKGYEWTNESMNGGVNTAGATTGALLGGQIALQNNGGEFDNDNYGMGQGSYASHENINIFIDGKQIIGAARKAERQVGKQVSSGILYE